MCCVSAVIVAIVFFVPPLSLATRLPALATSLHSLVAALAGAWLLLWWVPGLVVRLTGSQATNRWLDELVWAAHPQFALRLPLLFSLLVLALAAGGLGLVNALFRASFELDRNTVVLAGFALLVEVGRLFEAALRDEQAWLSRHRSH